MTYLERFFDEKDLSYKLYEIEVAGQTHMMDSETVIDIIMNCSAAEQKQIAAVLRKIDFANGDVHHFLQHLAKGYIANNY